MIPIRKLKWIYLSNVTCCHCLRSINTTASDIPIINFPIKTKRRIIQVMHKEKPKGKGSNVGNLELAKPGKIFISSDKKADSMYTTEYCTKFNPPSLTSSTWTSTRSPGSHFTIHPTKENPSLNVTSSASFKDLSLSDEIQEALRINSFITPTVIQSKAIPKILNGENVMFAAETGSGKTLAYLLPIMNQLLKTKEQENNETASGCRAMIVTPTVELVRQVENMANSLNLPLKFLSLYSAGDVKYAKSVQISSTDVLVATPVAILHALRRRKLILHHLEFAVLDECDTLLDDSFANSMVTMLKYFNIKKGNSSPVLADNEAQLVMSSATYPKYAMNALEEIIKDENVTSIRSGYLHRVSPHVKHQFIRVRPSEKPDKLFQLIETDNNIPTIIFCNYLKTALWLHRSLQERATPSLLIDGKLSFQERAERLKEFLYGDHNVLVATDLFSRGLDTKKVKRVINYEIPGAVSDYLHRAGRVGRVGQQFKSSVVSLVSKKWEVDVVTQIEEAARRREEISTVSANIKRRHQQRWRKKDDALHF